MMAMAAGASLSAQAADVAGSPAKNGATLAYANA
jgi:hypothetical protein